MKYIYQDSTELPVQRDFIEDLKTFLDITSRVIPLENSIIEIKCKNKEAIYELKSRIHGINNFEEKLNLLIVPIMIEQQDSFLASYAESLSTSFIIPLLRLE